MFQMTKEDAMNTLKNYSMLMSRVREVVDEIGFLDKEFDTLDINKTDFTKDSVHVVAYDGHYDLYDSVSCKFPLEFLFEPAEMHKDWYRKKCEAEEKKKQAEREEAEKEEELRLLKKLKLKYEQKWCLKKKHLPMKNMENLKKLKEKKFAEKADRSKNTISLLRKHAFVLAVIVAALMLFHAQKDYNNYAGSQLVMAEVINVEGADDKNINVAYRYNIAGKEYESDKMQYLEKIKKGDKKGIRVKKNNPEVILKYNDINYAVLCDVLIGLCLELAVLWMYKMTIYMLPSVEE